MADLILRYPPSPVVSRVRIAPGGLARLGTFVSRTTGARRVALLTDRNVARHHLTAARRALRAAGLGVEAIVLPPGERTKRVAVLDGLWRRFAALGLARGDAVVALGGGVVGDLAGFAAATWLRGVPWVGVPTSLLAQVDSSVGGKTAIDLPLGKNLVGAFHQPAGVLVDPTLLATLPPRQRRAGLAEVAKTGMAVDAPLFRWVEAHAEALARGDQAALATAVARAIRAKARIVRADERERSDGPRTALNYGHTLGHALEAATGYRGLLHGEAVALGMRAAAVLSRRIAGLPPGDAARLEALLDALGLPRRLPDVPLARVFDAMARDKKRDARGVRWVLTPRIGHASVPRLIPQGLVRAACRDLGVRARTRIPRRRRVGA